MSTAVFNSSFEDFSSKIILKHAPSSFIEKEFPTLFYKYLVSVFFEQLLLFDKVSIKLDKNYHPISLLLSEVGLDLMEDLFDQKAIEFIIWSPQLFILKGNDEFPVFPEEYF